MKPSLKKILKSDYKSMVCIYGIAIMVVLIILEKQLGFMTYLHSLYSDPQPIADDRLSLFEFLLVFFPIASVIVALYGIQRVLRIYFSFSKSTVVEGVVTEVPAVIMGMGQLKYKYLFNDKEYESENYVFRSKVVKSIELGQTVDVVVNSKKPVKAFVKKLYSSY